MDGTDPRLAGGGTDLVLLGGSTLQPDVVIMEGSSSSWLPQSMQALKISQVSVLDTGSSDLAGSNTITNLKDDASIDLDSTEVDTDIYPYDYEDKDDDEDEVDIDYDDGSAKYVIDNYDKLAAKFDGLDLPTGVEATLPWLLAPPSGTTSARQIPRNCESVLKNIVFRQFDTIQTCSDHFFLATNSDKQAAKEPPKDWVKRVQYEWKILEEDLPETIFVRAYEDRMDLLRAAIVGPAGTPYHDGLFFFDIRFPLHFPVVPPEVHYRSGGLHINPNLYECGYVCLSLLGTWDGHGCEKWNPLASTMLQVLVSIQGLVLNEKPYFNEPGRESFAGTPSWERCHLAYNEDVFVLSCKTMLYTLRKPPKNFEDLVYVHFRNRGRAVLTACLAYINGAQVGSALPDEVPDVDMTDDPGSSHFLKSLRKLYDELLMEFSVKDADCNDFFAKKAKEKAAGTDGNALLQQKVEWKSVLSLR